jgi:hypothetical protein
MRQKTFFVMVSAAVGLHVAILHGVLAAQPTDSALLSSFRWRNIGPSSMGGRVVDIEAVDTSFATVFVASASGGVFKSVNAGTTWTSVFERYRSASIGDIALFQKNPDIVWVGTGEANNVPEKSGHSLGWHRRGEQSQQRCLG